MKANDVQVGGTHYSSEIQHWDYVLANDIPYLEAQIIKYVTRWRKKNGIEDLEKAKHFLGKLIEVNKVEPDQNRPKHRYERLHPAQEQAEEAKHGQQLFVGGGDAP